ncbi:hypothetical protein V2J09_003832 [Rumex salicifolius]
MDSIEASASSPGFDQNVIVMRHGDRMDNFDPLWVKTAERPWDPPLVNAGRIRAFSTGRLLRSDRVGFPIHRVFVSPFLRCIQTALEATAAICAAEDDVGDVTKKLAADCAAIDSSKVKVSIEYGLCEMLNREAIRQESSPKDGNFHFNILDLEALLPAEMVDHNVERIYKELPRWEETVLSARTRYENVIRALADKYPSENLLLVTHGEGVGSSVTSFVDGAVVYEVNYCAYAHARRHILVDETKTHKAGRFELVTATDETGIKFNTSANLMSDGL